MDNPGKCLDLKLSLLRSSDFPRIDLQSFYQDSGARLEAQTRPTFKYRSLDIIQRPRIAGQQSSKSEKQQAVSVVEGKVGVVYGTADTAELVK